MTPVTILNDNSIAVQLPETAIDPWMLERNDPQLGYYIPNKTFGEEGNMWSESIKLPEGNWSILGRPEEMTEEQWKRVVLYDINPMQDYFEGAMDYGLSYENFNLDTCFESGLSLLKSKNIDPSKVIILIKQQ